MTRAEQILNKTSSVIQEREEQEYENFKAWKTACKKVDPKVWFEGDSDIASAMVGAKPFKKGKTYGIGEWDGETGIVYSSDDIDLVKSRMS